LAPPTGLWQKKRKSQLYTFARTAKKTKGVGKWAGKPPLTKRGWERGELDFYIPQKGRNRVKEKRKKKSNPPANVGSAPKETPSKKFVFHKTWKKKTPPTKRFKKMEKKKNEKVWGGGTNPSNNQTFPKLDPGGGKEGEKGFEGFCPRSGSKKRAPPNKKTNTKVVVFKKTPNNEP